MLYLKPFLNACDGDLRLCKRAKEITTEAEVVALDAMRNLATRCH